MRGALTWIRLRARATPLAGSSGVALALLAAAAVQGLARPGALGLGPGQATVLRDLAWRWLTPAAALLLLLCGTPAVVEGLCRRRLDGCVQLLAGDSALRPLGMDLLASLVLFGVMAAALGVPLVWVDRLVGLPPWALPRHLALLGAAAVLGAAAAQLGAWRRATFGVALARALVVEGLVVGGALWSVL